MLTFNNIRAREAAKAEVKAATKFEDVNVKEEKKEAPKKAPKKKAE